MVYGSTAYYGNTAWHGGVYGSSVTAVGPYGAARAGTAYNPATGTYARGASVSNAYGTAEGRSGIQPKHRSLCRHASDFQRLWELRKLGCVKERQYRLHPASNYSGRVCGNGTNLGGRQGCCGIGRKRNAAAGQTANGNKYAAANGNVYKNTGSGWQQTQGQKPTRITRASTLLRLAAMEGRQRSSGSSAFGGASGGGWQSRAESARGAASRGGGGGWRR